jgi:predicted TPR repeat methyltransferase/Flp pilus assembly protein TadD
MAVLHPIEKQVSPPLCALPIELPTRLQTQASVAVWRARYPRFRPLLVPQEPETRALRFVGLKLWEEGLPGEAVDVLTAAVASAPEDASLWSDLAGTLCALGRHLDAAACLAESLELDSGQPRAWLFLAMIHNTTQDHAAQERALRRALDLEPGLADASFSLGLLCFVQRRFEEAAERMQTAITHGCQTAAAHACLGQALYLQGDFSGAACAFAKQVELGPIEPKIIQKWALARMLEALIGGPVEAAFDVYHQVAGAHAEDLAKITQTAFYVLSGYGHREAAFRLGRARLVLAPADPVQSYLLRAVAGEPADRAPDDYLVAYYDQFADGYDKKLTEILDYHVPEHLHSLLLSTGRRFSRILDLGCGTGLAGSLLRSLGDHLAGVDLAPRMLEKARARHVYDRLAQTEAVSFLERSAEGAFDLVFIADVLVYMGDLRTFFRGAAHALADGGLLAFSVETTGEADFVLLPSGRFAHRLEYIAWLAQADFVIVETVCRSLRLEANRPVAGALFVLQRRGSAASFLESTRIDHARPGPSRVAVSRQPSGGRA